LAKTIGQQIGVHCRAKKKLALLEPSTRQAASGNSPSRLRPNTLVRSKHRLPKTDSIALPPTPNQPDFSNAVFTSLPRDQHGGPSKDHAGDGDRELALPAKRPAEAGRLC